MGRTDRRDVCEALQLGGTVTHTSAGRESSNTGHIWDKAGAFLPFRGDLSREVLLQRALPILASSGMVMNVIYCNAMEQGRSESYFMADNVSFCRGKYLQDPVAVCHLSCHYSLRATYVGDCNLDRARRRFQR